MSDEPLAREREPIERATKSAKVSTSSLSPKGSRQSPFVPKKEIDELYLNSPYYLVPDREVIRLAQNFWN
jgi:hypothetical protein